MGQNFVGLDVAVANSLGQNVVGQNFVGQDVTGAKSLGQNVVGQEVSGARTQRHWLKYLHINTFTRS